MKNRLRTATSLSLTALLLTAAPVAWGQDLVLNFDFAGEPGNQTSTLASAAAPGISGGIVDRGEGLSATSALNSLSTSGWDLGEDDFVSLRFTVAPGLSLNLDALMIGTRSSGTGPGFLGLFHNGDGFTQNLFTFEQSGTSFLNSTVDLTGLTGLTGEIEFRLIALNDTSAGGGTVSGSGTFRVTNFFDGGDTGGTTFTGTVIPEPSTYAAIFGVLVLAGAVFRRRFTRRR